MILNDFNLNKEFYLKQIKEAWLSAGCQFPDFLSKIEKETKEKNEQYIQSVSQKVNRQMKRYTRLPILSLLWRKKMLKLITDLLNQETIISIHTVTNIQTLNNFQEELKELLRNARVFAPELTLEELGQAVRNYIVYVMFKEIHLDKTVFSNACFGYSMLYPFTDNYIDSKYVSTKEKAEYNQLIRDKIAGKTINPNSIHQIKTCKLLDAIENDYPRSLNSCIYSLLSEMLEAQEVSLRQQNRAIPLSSEDRLHISVLKGSISVLIDRYFVNKEITNEDLHFYLGMGFFLQLADDLQDIKEDSVNGYQTIFTENLEKTAQEKLVNKLLHFIHELMDSYEAENNPFKEFVLINCYQLVFLSLTGSKEFFSKDYLEKMEDFIPVSYAYFEAFKGNHFQKNGNGPDDKYMKMLDRIIAK